jgi:Ca-activated chloride channel homolog
MQRTYTGTFLLLVFVSTSLSQRISPVPRDEPPFMKLELYIKDTDSMTRHQEVQSPVDSVSKLDLKAPRGARKEYDRGVQLLIRKRFADAVAHLAKSISIYPSFVAAHNALGSAYIDLGQNDPARSEFLQATLLDDHLPRSYLNLGRAELALKHYPAAEEAIQKASSIEPLDLHLLTALTYVQFLNHDYGAAVATALRVHGRKHEGAAIVHYFAAAAWQDQNHLEETKQELETLLAEDPNSPAATLARQTLATIEQHQNQPAPGVTISFVPSSGEVQLAPGEMASRDRKILQEFEEQKQVEEAGCETCVPARSPSPVRAGALPGVNSGVQRLASTSTGWTLRSTVDEVPVFFAATDRGKSITNLKEGDVQIRDAGRPPASITGFRNESRLPLRMGLVIDTSASTTSRFSFEQAAASEFLRQVVTGKDDLAFVVGFANSILLVQDFTGEKKLISHGIGELAPAGGTAIWDAVAFASDKLARRTENGPVAKILVIISDGDDNSSSVTLKEAIEAAERGEVIVYAVSIREANEQDDLASVGNRALRVLAQRTGGAVFFPASASHLERSLSELQEVIRSRYLISYKPAFFKQDGQYRTIDISAEKFGRKLRVYARKGYFAEGKSNAENKF